MLSMWDLPEIRSAPRRPGVWPTARTAPGARHVDAIRDLGRPDPRVAAPRPPAR
ncbi:hypothetical protein Ae406Ps2_5094 [Pseudonocardia sp. Ae406_Ps2]|nr:hypothetical protein Ae331Ps2_0863c [Pseudonocardia sp. Ae331_Ps2]OLM05094.1 hypothetical protein Ae406Ps2_5094 [Pseudonocardia sp. Ae406_Ps2]OLM10095.1 hypothetical protein Ae505Ps2_0217c [Pseudonocardia sp. Ae505_Ps2]OLM26663.1 hypothetical protein Ae706Ps2_5096 [Pseudonocardia sp. Ae706_Ps2]